MQGTGGGFVFRTMKPEFCAAPYLPHHCFAFDLHETGGVWLDAPYWMPAGSTVKNETDPLQPVVYSRAAWRDGGCL